MINNLIKLIHSFLIQIPTLASRLVVNFVFMAFVYGVYKLLQKNVWPHQNS